ncbi:hypothetical protein HanHA300_Chr01g0001931 [Helianthus annuus]|nr:hypothetical protein HanHA300_Chr01g0001931 [Helianthus annuus]KAJ0625478.1 hypothetical protein HanHA89_Chr01g0002121 [Helianthus annuus]
MIHKYNRKGAMRKKIFEGKKMNTSYNCLHTKKTFFSFIFSTTTLAHLDPNYTIYKLFHSLLVTGLKSRSCTRYTI